MLQEGSKFSISPKILFFLAPIGLKFWDQAFLDLEIQKIHSVWHDFSKKINLVLLLLLLLLLKFWDQASLLVFRDLEIQKIHSVWHDFFNVFFHDFPYRQS